MLECFIYLSVCEIIFGIVSYTFRYRETFDSINLVILLGKWYINACKICEKALLMSNNKLQKYGSISKSKNKRGQALGAHKFFGIAHVNTLMNIHLHDILLLSIICVSLSGS